MVSVALLMPASSPGWRSMTSRLKPRRSVQRRYMRSSISAQSCDSVPPAPGWIVTMAFLRSCSPPSIFLVSPASTCADELVERRAPRSSATGSPASAHSTRTARSSSRRLQRVAQIASPPRAGGGAAAPSAPRPGPSRSRERRRVRSILRELVGGAGGVKDGSAGRRRGAPDPGTCEAVRRVARP